jgi:NitT/TauT family transport system substrate-binding protein
VPFLEGLLASNGIDPATDVSIIESGDGGPTAVAFQNDSIEAYFSDYFNLIELGFEVPLHSFDLGEFGLLHAASVVVKSELIDSDPQLIECVTRAMARATEFTHASPEAALIAIAEAYPEQVTDPEGFDLLAIEETITRTEQYEESGGLWGWNRPESWAGYIELLGSRGELTADIDPETLYTNDFIDAANDFDKAAEAAAAEELAG